MTVPVLVLFTLLARAASYVLIHPTTWIVLLGWLLRSRPMASSMK